MSDLPTPPTEDYVKSHHHRRPSKSSSSKPAHRSSKRQSTSHDHGSMTMDGRHKRVWKACERCRMKKTKCDGESPCKRCKDDGLVCTAGSRKKTEFKQLPRGYAEVLENTQYALIATVQKLYTMVRNNEAWEHGEPEMNDRGQPVIHDIASKLGCIRPSPDLPYTFPEGEADFAELQAQLQSARSKMAAEDSGSRKNSEDSSAYSPVPLSRTERASSSESDHSTLSREYNQVMWQQSTPAPTTKTVLKQTPLRPSLDDESYPARGSYDTSRSPIYTDFQTESPMFRASSPFAPWSAGDDFMGQQAHALDITAHYMRAQQFSGMPRSTPMIGQMSGLDLEPEMLKAMQLNGNGGINFDDGTIRPNMLDCGNGIDLSEQMDSIIYGGDYEMQMGVA